MGLAYFPFYPSDWLSSASVKKLTREARSMYLDLLCYMWQTQDCSLENNIPELCSLLDTQDENLVTNLVTKTMTISSDGTRLENLRLKTEHEKAHKAYKSRVETAKNARQHIETKKKNRSVKSLRHNQNQNQTKEKIEDVPPKMLFLRFVFLTQDESEKLKDKFNGSFDAMIERLDLYIGQIGVKKAAEKYKSHYYTLLNWWRKDHPTDEERPYVAKFVT